MPPTLFRFTAFFLFTQGEMNLVNININKAGTSAAAPRFV
jgi:hypothetical protein